MHRLLSFGLVTLFLSGFSAGELAGEEVNPSERTPTKAERDDAPKLVDWTIPFPGRALHSQVLVLDGTLLYALGGNASPGPHDFSKEAFVDEAFRFDIGQRIVERLPNLPIPLQSGSGVYLSHTSEHSSVFVIGGMSHIDGKFRSLDEVFEYDPGAESWSAAPVKLPAPRSMFSAVTYDDAIWMFGGSVVGQGGGYAEEILHWWGDETDIAPLPATKVPVPRRSFGGAVLKEEYYMVGGLGKEGDIVESVSVFNFKDRTWKEAPSPHVSRVFPSLAEMKGRLYLFGGFARTEEGHFAPETSLEMFDPAVGKWKVLAESLPGVDASMTMLRLNSRLLFYGIDREKPGTAKFFMCDPHPNEPPPKVPTVNFANPRDNGSSAVRNAKLMLRKDTDKDGKISRAEIGARLVGLFETADTNQDGFLTFEELVAALQEEEPAENGEQD